MASRRRRRERYSKKKQKRDIIVSNLEDLKIWELYSNDPSRRRKKPVMVSHPKHPKLKFNKHGVERVVKKLEKVVSGDFPNFKKIFILPDSKDLQVLSSNGVSFRTSSGTSDMVQESEKPYSLLYITTYGSFGSVFDGVTSSRFGYSSNKLPDTDISMLVGGKYITISANTDSYVKVDAITDYFNGSARIMSREFRHESFYNSIHDESLRKNTLRALAMDAISYSNNGKTKIDEEKLVYLLMKHNSTPALFRFEWTQKILLYLLDDKIKSAKEKMETVKMLDMSSGWGDRLLAALSIPEIDYTGFDVNKDLVDGYHDIISYMSPDKDRARIYIQPFEENETLEEEYYDIAFSSPPFFIKEIYVGENQSTKKFPGFEEWMVGFLFHSLIKIWKSLKVGGIMAVHMADFQFKDAKYVICEPMNLFIENNLGGSEFMGCIGLVGKTNPTPSDQRIGVWIWKKVDGERSLWSRNGNLAPRSLSMFYPSINDMLIRSYIYGSMDGNPGIKVYKFLEKCLNGEDHELMLFAKRILFTNKLNVLSIKNSFDKESDAIDFVRNMTISAYLNRGPIKF